MRKILMATALAAASVNAHALAGLSRACAFDTIPSSMQVAAARLANIIGAAPLGKFDGLSDLSPAQQHRWWALEALTIDWASARYYLYAEARLYWRNPRTAGDGAWRYFRAMSSPGWQAQTLPQDVLNDGALSIFFHNRTFLYSARAGHPEIFEYLADPGDTEYMTQGNHAYYSPVADQRNYLGRTVATTCALDQWGFGDR